MRLIGGWIPFVGFQDLEVEEDDVREELGMKEGDKMSFFCIEWLERGVGWAFFPVDKDQAE